MVLVAWWLAVFCGAGGLVNVFFGFFFRPSRRLGGGVVVGNPFAHKTVLAQFLFCSEGGGGGGGTARVLPTKPFSQELHLASKGEGGGVCRGPTKLVYEFFVCICFDETFDLIYFIDSTKLI